MARWTVDNLVRPSARSPTGRFALRVARDLRDIELFDRGMTLAAHIFTSILPILIVAGALRSRLDPQAGAIIAEHLGLSESTADLLRRSLPAAAQELTATGVVGVLFLIIASTSFARALERCFRRIWHAPKAGYRSAWRWLVAIVAIVIGIALIVSTRTIVHGDGAMPVVEFIAEVVIWGALWWIASWIVIDRAVRLRALLPGSVLAGLGFAVAAVIGRIFLPPILASSAAQFGVLGLAFSYIGWLFILMCVLVAAATIGRVVSLTSEGRAWRRSASVMQETGT
jgi:membrane protein